MLAQATYTGETTSGWQQVDFTSPVSISANTTYVAALFTTTFSGTQSYFASSGVDNAPLHALRSGVDGGNGVYSYAATPQFPVSSWSDTNYWVDVVFSPAQVAAPTFSPNPGSYTSQQQVTLTDSTSGAAVRYTLDGSTPSSTTGTVYAGPITISSTTTVKAIAYAAGMLDSAIVSATYTINSGATTLSIFAPSAAPADPPNTSDPVTLGVKFRSDVAGTVNGIRFYKGTGNNGAHIGLLYNSAGTLLAQATFTGETASGWQQVDFSTPVTISADTTYIAAYFSTALSATVNGFTSAGVDNAPLHGLRSGVDGGNGVYTYGSNPQFPFLTWADCNYWVDLSFSPSTPPPVSAPTPTVVSASSQSGLSQIFTAGYQDPVSYSNITEAQIMLQNGQNAANSCNARYAAGNFWLRNDGDTGWLGPLTTQTPLENSQCVLSGGTWSNATGTGVTLTVNYALSFKSGFDGPKNIYLRAANAGGDSGWVLKTSNWNIARVGQLPVNESVTPSSGFGLTQTFQATSMSPNGYPYITTMEMIVNYGVTLGGSCYLIYSPPSNTIILVDDDGTIPWQGGKLLGSTDVLENSQCRLDLAGSSRSFSFNRVSVNLALTFKAGLPGPQKIIMSTTDGSGQNPYQTVATWTTSTVNSQGPSAVSVSPNPGVPAMTQAFTYTARSVNGWDYIANMYMKLSPTLASDQACVLYFSRWEGVWLNDDTGNIFANHARLGKPGEPPHNSRCTLDAEHSSWSYSGTDLSMTLQFTFDPSFAGAKTQYMYVTDRGNNIADWQQVGTFTVGSSPDFNLTVGPASSAVMPGGSANYSVVVTPSNNFTGVVTLSAANLPPGVTAQFNPPTLTASGTSTMTLSTTSGTQAVTSTVTVTASSGSLVHNATSSLVVQDFSIGISPGTASTLPGGTASYTLTVTPINGFSGLVNFNASGAQFNPPSLTGGGSTVMSIAVNTNTPAGTSSVTVNATSGALNRPAQVSLAVQDFTIALTGSGPQPVVSGGTTSYTFTVTPQNGFTGPISFSVSGLPGTVTPTFSPPTLIGGGTAVLTVSTMTSTLAGSFPLSINASSSGRTKPVSATLQVPVTITISPSVQTSPVLPLGGVLHLTATVTGTPNHNVCWSSLPTPIVGIFYPAPGIFTSDPSCNGNTATFTAFGNPGFLNPNIKIQARPQNYPDVVQELDGAVQNCRYCLTISRDTLNFPNDPPDPLRPGQSVHLIANMQGGGTVINWYGPAGTLSVTGGSLTTVYTAPQDTSGSSIVHILASSQDSWAELDLTRVATDSPPSPAQSDFTITASPSSNTVTLGGTATYTITTSGTGGTVDFTVSGCPQNATCTIYPHPVGVGGSSTLTITTSAATPVAPYDVTIRGTTTDGTITHSLSPPLRLAVQTVQSDFYLTISPASQSVGAVGSVVYAVRVNPLNGFSNTVTFSTANLLGLPSGATAAFTQLQITSAGTTFLSITPSCTSAATIYPLTITGTSGFSRSASASLTINAVRPCVPATVISPSPESILSGGSATFKWDCGTGATAYNLAAGSSPGAIHTIHQRPVQLVKRSLSAISLGADRTRTYM